MNVAIIGSGFIGQKRAKVLGEHRLVAVADIIEERAHSLAQLYKDKHKGTGAVDVVGWEKAASHPDADIVLVSTTPDNLARITQACVEAGKHVLVDKPAGRYPEELDSVIAAAERKARIVKVGFNHRYHPSFQKARQLVDAGALGPLLYIRARYGHGGRPGYEKEWRANPQISGGGELLDQGSHLIDLSRWFLGEFETIDGFAHTYFWDMPVDDNAFMMLRTATQQAAWLHVSWTEWKNLFCFEIFGRDGKLQIDGLGGSYGLEQLTFYKMKPEMGPPETEMWQYPGEDKSWEVEFKEFLKSIAIFEDKEPGEKEFREMLTKLAGSNNRQPGLEDARAALSIVHGIYKDNKKCLLQQAR